MYKKGDQCCKYVGCRLLWRCSVALAAWAGAILMAFRQRPVLPVQVQNTFCWIQEVDFILRLGASDACACRSKLV